MDFKKEARYHYAIILESFTCVADKQLSNRALYLLKILTIIGDNADINLRMTDQKNRGTENT